MLCIVHQLLHEYLQCIKVIHEYANVYMYLCGKLLGVPFVDYLLNKINYNIKAHIIIIVPSDIHVLVHVSS